MFPRHEIFVFLPEPLSPKASPNARITKIHNAVVKAAMRLTLEQHWKDIIPKHFRLSAKRRYRHRERSPRTQAIKQRSGFTIPDLVKKGDSRRKMTKTKPIIRVGGSAFLAESTGKPVSGSLIMKWPSGMKDRAGTKGIKIRDMAEEISRWTKGEERNAAARFLENYKRLLKAEMDKRPRVRARFAEQLSALGI